MSLKDRKSTHQESRLNELEIKISLAIRSKLISNTMWLSAREGFAMKASNPLSVFIGTPVLSHVYQITRQYDKKYTFTLSEKLSISLDLITILISLTISHCDSADCLCASTNVIIHLGLT